VHDRRRLRPVVLSLFRAAVASRLVPPLDQSGDGGPHPLGLRPLHDHRLQQLTAVVRHSPLQILEQQHAALQQCRVVLAEAAILKE